MDIAESVHHILKHGRALADLFYNRFLQDEEVRGYFDGIDLRRQSVKLTLALMVMERHYSCSYPVTEHYLRHLAAKHHVRGVPHALYPKFREHLLASLERFHAENWGPALAGQWREAIDRTIAVMLDGRREHMCV